MPTTVYNLAGEKVEELTLDDYLFSVVPKNSVVHQVVVAQENNNRQVLSHTKTKAEVRGGGKKPWKQKGTGRARAGSIRSPLWRGGGVTFGPRKDRNYSQKVNKKMKNLALRMVLSDKVAENNFIIVDQLVLPERKTKKLVDILNKLPVGQNKVLVGLAKTDTKLIAAAKNLAKVFVSGVNSLNIVDLLKYKYLLVSKAGLEEIKKIYGKKK